MKKKIGIITADYPLGVLSDVTSMAFCLANEGFVVDIFIDQYMYESAKIDFKNNNINVIAIKTSLKSQEGFWSNRIFQFSLGGAHDRVTKKIRNLKNIIFPKNLKRIKNYTSLKEKLWYYQKHFFLQGYKFTKGLENYASKDYICFIAIEPQSLICATIIALDKNIPVIYHNMELLLVRECKSDIEKMTKELEIECSQKCLFTIIQDENRARYFVEDNKVNPNKIRLLPVSSKEEKYEKKSDYLYKELHIPEGKIIILYAGSISYPAMILEIARAAKQWKDDYVLVLHSWNKFSPRDGYSNELKKIVDNNKIYLSTTVIDFSQLPELISSAKIGVVFYRNLSPNYYEVGSASNKFVQYLRTGLPVISIDFPSFKEKIEKNNCGICVATPDFIENAIDKIMGNYSYYSNNAYGLYEKDYNFSKNFKHILEDIKNIS